MGWTLAQAWEVPFDEVTPLLKMAQEIRREHLLELRFYLNASQEQLKTLQEPQEQGLEGWIALAEGLARTDVTGRAEKGRAGKMRRHLRIMELLKASNGG